MATRPVYIPETEGSALVSVRSVDFAWHAGMSMSRRQKSMRSLHHEISELLPKTEILEVSRMSDLPLGAALSAFNLTFTTKKRTISVESAFQASKVFERAGPFPDLLDASPMDAKRDPRLKASGQLIGFRFFGVDWPKDPPTALYDWIYLNALHRHADLGNEVMRYGAFTDIAFNPQKSINCQAGAVALFVALTRRKKLEGALSSCEAFLAMLNDAYFLSDDLISQRTLL